MNEQNTCPRCGGTGWEIKSSNGVEYAVRCTCSKNSIILTRGDRANIPPRFNGTNLKGYLVAKGNRYQARAKKNVQGFIDSFPATSKGLLLQGPVGVGKTKLLCAIAGELLQRENSLDVYYVDWNDLVRTMRSGEDHASRNFADINQMISRMTSVDLLLFDELGASRVSPWVQDNIYYLINRRYNTQKLTCFATNYFDDMADGNETLTQRVGPRIRSRLYEMTDIVTVPGNDYRNAYR